MNLTKKIYLIDTNVILRYLLGDHPKFSPKAESFMGDISEGTKKAVLFARLGHLVPRFVFADVIDYPDEYAHDFAPILRFSGSLKFFDFKPPRSLFP